MKLFQITIFTLIYTMQNSGLLASLPMFSPYAMSNIHFVYEFQPIYLVCSHIYSPVHMSFPTSPSSNVKLVPLDRNGETVREISEHTVMEYIDDSSERPYKVKFIRHRARWGDSGWYGCATKEVKIEKENSLQENVQWTYVMVKSNVNWFVENFHSFPEFYGKLGTEVVIPCRSTNPKFEVTFETENGVPIAIDTSRMKYDYRRGLIISNFKKEDAIPFKCFIDNKDSPREYNRLQWNSFDIKYY